MKNGVFWDEVPRGVTSQKTPFFRKQEVNGNISLSFFR
jgi:hypothetical protein